MKAKRSLNLTIRYAVLTAVSLLVVFPFLWMVTTSLKTFSNVLLFPPQWIPRPVQWVNFIDLFKRQPFHLYLFNSSYIAAVVTVGTCFLGALAGYAFAKISFRFKNIIFLFLLSSMMIPVEVTAVPLFKILSAFGLVNTHFPLIYPQMLGAGGALGMFMCRQFFITIPTETDEAAKIDGCTPWRTFLTIMLPLATPVISTVSIFTLLNSWNDFFEPLVYLNSSRLYTIPLALSLFSTDAGTQWHLVMAAAVVSTLPLLTFFFVAQNKFIEGIATTGMK